MIPFVYSIENLSWGFAVANNNWLNSHGFQFFCKAIVRKKPACQNDSVTCNYMLLPIFFID